MNRPRYLPVALLLWGTAAILLIPLQQSSAAVGHTDHGNGSERSAQPWVWPLDPPPGVVEPFDRPGSQWGAGHRGVDLAAQPGQEVLAIRSGRVTFAGELAGRGVVVVSHGALRSTYEPVSATVVVGDPVATGQVVGVLQASGSHCAPLTCLHLGLKRGDRYLDPLRFLGAAEVRLKPLAGLPGDETLQVDLGRPEPDGSTSGARGTQREDAAAGLTLTRGLLGAGAAIGSGLLVGSTFRRPQARG